MEQYRKPDATKYWQWSMPSLILAFATLVLWGLSELRVQPKLLERYQASVDGYEKDLVDQRRVIEECVQGELAVNSGEVGETLVNMIDTYVSTAKRNELACKRIAIFRPRDPSSHLRQARAAFRTAYGYQLRARRSNIASSTNAYSDADYWNTLYQQSMEAGVRGMQLASRLQGESAKEAQLWLIEHALTAEYPLSDKPSLTLKKIADSAADFKDADAPATLHVLGRLSLCQALTPDETGLSVEHRIALAELAYRRLESTTPATSFEVQAWRLEGSALLAGDSANHEARNLLTQVLNNPSNSVLWPVTELEAAFRIMMLVTGPKEALAFASSRLQSLVASEQLQLRSMVAASLIRFAVASAAFPESSQATSAPSDFLASAFLFAPGTPWVDRFADELIFDELDVHERPFDLLIQQLPPQHPLRVLSSWIRTELQQEADGISNRFPECDPQWVVGFLPALLQRWSHEPSDRPNISKVIDRWIELFPMEYDIRMARVTLSLKANMRNQARSDLEWLQNRLPQNRSIEKLLERVGSL